ncbi:MAG: hypothetical protein E8D49_10145 [Nitrospira sp.]|nr:MAG: hypothetical protein E8D49_10145 [Nitrospira sp.]
MHPCAGSRKWYLQEPEGLDTVGLLCQVWLFKPDGTVTKIFEPTGKEWERMGWGHYQLTKKGLFLVGGTGKYD